MIVHLRPEANPTAVHRSLVDRGLWPQRLEAVGLDELGVQYRIGSASNRVSEAELLAIEGIAGVAEAPSPHPLVGRPAGAGSRWPVSPSAAKLRRYSWQARAVSNRHPRSNLSPGASLPWGVTFLRGAAPSNREPPPTPFQGHGAVALEWQRRAADAHGLRVVTEALAESHAEKVAELADLVQIGSRNMQNTALLKVVAGTGKPVLLKRDMAATVQEWLLGRRVLPTPRCRCSHLLRAGHSQLRQRDPLRPRPGGRSLAFPPYIGSPSSWILPTGLAAAT